MTSMAASFCRFLWMCSASLTGCFPYVRKVWGQLLLLDVFVSTFLWKIEQNPLLHWGLSPLWFSCLLTGRIRLPGSSLCLDDRWCSGHILVGVATCVANEVELQLHSLGWSFLMACDRFPLGIYIHINMSWIVHSQKRKLEALALCLHIFVPFMLVLWKQMQLVFLLIEMCLDLCSMRPLVDSFLSTG